LKQVDPIEFILSDNNVIIFDYYPLLLYYPGKRLKKKFFYNLFNDLFNNLFKSTKNIQEKVLIDMFYADYQSMLTINCVLNLHIFIMYMQ